MFTSAIKKQTSVCCSISLNPYMVFQTWNLESRKKNEKRKPILLLSYIADVSCLTNCPFYMRTLSLRKIARKQKYQNSENLSYIVLCPVR